MATVGLPPFARIALQVSKAVLPRLRGSVLASISSTSRSCSRFSAYEAWTFREAQKTEAVGVHRDDARESLHASGRGERWPIPR
jgi:hypothetical protein